VIKDGQRQVWRRKKADDPTAKVRPAGSCGRAEEKGREGDPRFFTWAKEIGGDEDGWTIRGREREKRRNYETTASADC